MELTAIVELGRRHFVVKTMKTRLFGFELRGDLYDLALSADGLSSKHLQNGCSGTSISLQARFEPGVAENLRLLRSDWWLPTSRRVINF